jgi:exonuclease III
VDKYTNLKIVSYNCKGLKSSIDDIRNLCETYDVVMLQETWLMPEDLPILNSIHPNYHGNGVSAMDPTGGLLLGRPFGGVGIMWKKSYTQLQFKTYDDSRIIGLELKSSYNCEMLLLNVYLPYQCSENLDSYRFYLGKIEAIMETSCASCIGIIGDFNADVNTRFEQELLDMCNNTGLKCVDYELLGRQNDNFTYVSYSHNTTSWLDHIIGSHYYKQATVGVEILPKLPGSDHLPVTTTLKLLLQEADTLIEGSAIKTKTSVTWNKASQEELKAYTAATSEALSKILIPVEAILCDNNNCRSAQHRKDIELFYNSICESLVDASHRTLPMTKSNKQFEITPGWNALVKEAHAEARQAYIIWRDLGKPRQGTACELMRKTRLNFKYSLRQCHKQEAAARAEAMANSLTKHDNIAFWKEIRNSNNTRVPLATTVDGITGEKQIVNRWEEHFSQLLNSVHTETNKTYVQSTLNKRQGKPDSQITSEEVTDSIKDLKSGKACGHDGITSEHLKFSGRECHIHLALCLTAILHHGFLPSNCMKTVLVPIIKNKAGDHSDIGNYRPIALVTVVSKVLEYIILKRLQTNVDITDHQFGFKKAHGTDMCVYSFKQIVEYYNKHASPVYACFLDASKAFDRVNHWTLFRRLLDRGVPLNIVNTMTYWYTHQQCTIQWGREMSKPFKVSNGVRQGGILSPLLFNLYMDELSRKLGKMNIGCKLNGHTMNHLMYADDLVLLAPSPKALQKLINQCCEFGEANDIRFNAAKSALMVFKSHLTKTRTPTLFINGNVLQEVSQYKYLGYCISDNLKDTADIKRQICGIYGRANMLIRKFIQCSSLVKQTLFRSYCTGLYCAHLWTNHTKQDFAKVKASYNNSFRYLFGYSKRCSASAMLCENNMPGFDALCRNVIYGFRSRIANSDNVLLQTLYKMMGPGNNMWDTWQRALYI